MEFSDEEHLGTAFFPQQDVVIIVALSFLFDKVVYRELSAGMLCVLTGKHEDFSASWDRHQDLVITKT